jgi:uncharacterized membrane protein YkvA (DUF1232 family)
VAVVRPLLIALLVAVGLYAAFLLALVLLGRGAAARAWLRLVPDCAVLCGRLLRDPRVPRSRKVALALLAVYLASPIDLVPDFIPVAGALDDAVLVGLVLRGVVRAAGEHVVRQRWPGTPDSLALLLRLVRP